MADHGERQSAEHDWNLGMTAALATLLFAVLRLLAISHYNWETAFALAETLNIDDAVGVITGTILGAPTMMAGLLALLLPVLIAAHAREFRAGRRRLGRLLLMLVIVALFLAGVITFRMWWALILLASVAAVTMLLVRWGGAGQRIAHGLVHRLGPLMLAVTLLLASVTDEVWVPKERITLTNGVVIGYVLGSDGTFLKVLTADDRRVRILLATEVTARTGVR